MIENLATKLKIATRIPVIHKYVYTIILERKSRSLVQIPTHVDKIERWRIKEVLSSNMIPSKIQDIFLNEMEYFGLIKQDRKIIRVIKQ